MKRRCVIAIMAMCLVLSACGNPSKNNTNETEAQQNSEVYEVEEVTYMANMYKCVKDEQTGKEKYGLLLKEPLTYKGEDFSFGASMYIQNRKLEDDNIPVLCILLLDGIPIKFSIDGNEQGISHEVMLQNGVETRFKIELQPYGVTEEPKDLVLLGIPFAKKEKITVYENTVLCCSNEIVSASGSLKGDKKKKTKCSYVGDISEVILSEIEAQGLENGQEQYINNYIYSDNTDYYFTSDISEGENETLLFCDGKLFAGFDKSEYFFWEGKGEYVNMKLDMETLTNGAHTFFAVTIENVDGVISANKSLNKEINVNEKK